MEHWQNQWPRALEKNHGVLLPRKNGEVHGPLMLSMKRLFLPRVYIEKCFENLPYVLIVNDITSLKYIKNIPILPISILYFCKQKLWPLPLCHQTICYLLFPFQNWWFYLQSCPNMPGGSIFLVVLPRFRCESVLNNVQDVLEMNLKMEKNVYKTKKPPPPYGRGLNMYNSSLFCW